MVGLWDPTHAMEAPNKIMHTPKKRNNIILGFYMVRPQCLHPKAQCEFHHIGRPTCSFWNVPYTNSHFGWLSLIREMVAFSHNHYFVPHGMITPQFYLASNNLYESWFRGSHRIILSHLATISFQFCLSYTKVKGCDILGYHVSMF